MPPLALRASQAIVALLGLAGGFATKIAPPPQIISTGFATIILIILFLLVVAARKERKRTMHRHWIPLAASFGAAGVLIGFTYIFAKQWFVFTYPSGSDHELVRGLWMTEEAAGLSRMDPAVLLENFGGEPHLQDAWPPLSTLVASSGLLIGYVATLVALYGAIIFISEGLFGSD